MFLSPQLLWLLSIPWLALLLFLVCIVSSFSIWKADKKWPKMVFDCQLNCTHRRRLLFLPHLLHFSRFFSSFVVHALPDHELNLRSTNNATFLTPKSASSPLPITNFAIAVELCQGPAREGCRGRSGTGSYCSIDNINDAQLSRTFTWARATWVAAALGIAPGYDCIDPLCSGRATAMTRVVGVVVPPSPLSFCAA